VTSEPDVTAVPLDGTEDFLVLACDGLWDFVSEQEAVMAVYQQIAEAPGKDMSHAEVIWSTKPFIRLLSTKISRIDTPNKLD
jgi:protein phosphatase 1E